MQVEWWTLGLQAVNFLVLAWLLWRFLYRPVRKVIEKRKVLAEQAFADADTKKSEAEAERRHFELCRVELVQERQDMLATAHKELEIDRNAMLDAARHEANELIRTAREAIVEERQAALAEIRVEVAAVAVELASNLLRKSGKGVSNGVFLEQLEKQLRELPTDERDRLQKDLLAGGARLTIATATSLTPDERHQWVDRISACLGQNHKTEFATDPDIVGGAELHFPHAVLKFTWADQLRRAQELLAENEVAS